MSRYFCSPRKKIARRTILALRATEAAATTRIKPCARFIALCLSLFHYVRGLHGGLRRALLLEAGSNWWSPVFEHNEACGNRGWSRPCTCVAVPPRGDRSQTDRGSRRSSLGMDFRHLCRGGAPSCPKTSLGHGPNLKSRAAIPTSVSRSTYSACRLRVTEYAGTRNPEYLTEGSFPGSRRLVRFAQRVGSIKALSGRW